MEAHFSWPCFVGGPRGVEDSLTTQECPENEAKAPSGVGLQYCS